LFKVTIIMPAFNASLHVADALASLLVQREAAKLEVLVVDDGSTDDTLRIVAAISQSAPEVRLLAGPHRGVSAARNAAIGTVAPDTDIVTFLDADDLSPPGRFARDLAAFRDDVDVRWGMTRRFNSRGASDELERGSQLGAIMLRMDTLGRLGGFDERYALAEDVDFVLRMLETRPRLSLSDEAAVLYRVHDSNTSRDMDLVRRTLTSVYLAAARRRMQGAAAVPAGIFRPLGKPP
jgi:glycosyltransferase involved in cell wall biosynthesis